jgi:hypothetical protein
MPSFDAGSLARVGTAASPFTSLAGGAVNPTTVYLAAGVITYDGNGTPNGPNLETEMWTWTSGGPNAGSGVCPGGIQNDSAGVFHADLDTTGTIGPWLWRIWGVGVIQASFTGTFDVTQPQAGWPYPWGYCSNDDVQDRINAGSWDSTVPLAQPPQSTVNKFIGQVSSLIDSRLLANGFYVPLQVQASFPGGQIMPQAWLLLKMCAADWAAGLVEKTRHGSQDENVDAHAKDLLDASAALLEQLGGPAAQGSLSGLKGAVNGEIYLSLFGCAGPFVQVADKSKGIAIQGGPNWIAQAINRDNPFSERRLRGLV